MDETEKYIRSLLQQQGIVVNQRLDNILRAFAADIENINNVKSIRLLQENMTKNWQLIARREEISSMQIHLPNGMVGKPYKAEFNFSTYGLTDITSYRLTGFEDSGLAYNPENGIIEGTPGNSGDILLTFTYNFTGEPEDALPNTKKISIIINADPKLLWQDIPSDASDVYAKPDNVAEAGTFLGKSLVAASKRGRSHANKGSYREDDYAYAELGNGWGVITISDGAGSAVFSRKGSQLACAAVISYFTEKFIHEDLQLLDEAIIAYSSNALLKSRVQDIASPYLSAAAAKAYRIISAFAKAANAKVPDFHATLAFVLVKQYTHGYAFFSFSVGDCPIVLANRDFSKITPLGKLDTGDYGGGTRFVTMPEIFTNGNFDNRLHFEFTSDFPYLALMTDGIYDPKFEVEANLTSPEKWSALFNDLNGNNEEQAKVILEAGNPDIAHQLSVWMDFWSAGNHDDRTLILVF